MQAFNLRRYVDVGASKDVYSRKQREPTEAQVIAFEPHPNSLRKLNELAAPYAGRLRSENFGVSDGSGELLLWRNPLNLEQASLAPEVELVPHVDNIQLVKVPVATIYARLAKTYATADTPNLPCSVVGAVT